MPSPSKKSWYFRGVLGLEGIPTQEVRWLQSVIAQLGFGFQPKIVVDFAGDTLTTDAGLVLVREFDELCSANTLSGRRFDRIR